MSKNSYEKISKEFSQYLFSDLSGGGQRSRPLPLSPLTSTLPPLVSLFLSRSSGRFAFPSPFFFTLSSSLSLLPPLLPLFPTPHPPYLLPCPSPHLRDEVEKCKKRPKGPHIVHLSIMCHHFEELARAAIFVY